MEIRSLELPLYRGNSDLLKSWEVKRKLRLLASQTSSCISITAFLLHWDSAGGVHGEFWTGDLGRHNSMMLKAGDALGSMFPTGSTMLQKNPCQLTLCPVSCASRTCLLWLKLLYTSTSIPLIQPLASHSRITLTKTRNNIWSVMKFCWLYKTRCISDCHLLASFGLVFTCIQTVIYWAWCNEKKSCLVVSFHHPPVKYS